MGNRLKFVPAPLGAVAVASLIATVPAAAQSRGGAAATPPTILGPAMLRPGTADLSCGAGPAGLGPWSTDRIEQTLSLTDAQLMKFNGLKAASERATQYLNESCPKNEPITPTGRLQAMERRLAAMLEAVRTVEPALDDFYAVLTDEQKARLNAIEPAKARDGAATADGRRGRGAQPSPDRVSSVEADKSQAGAAEPSNDSEDETYVDRRGRVHRHHHHGHRHFGFRLRIPFLF